MIELTDRGSGYDQKVIVNPLGILRVSEAGVSARWHGINSFVRLMDGSVIEAWEDVTTIKNLMAGTSS